MKERELGGGEVAELKRVVREGPSEKLFEKRLEPFFEIGMKIDLFWSCGHC